MSDNVRQFNEQIGFRDDQQQQLRVPPEQLEKLVDAVRMVMEVDDVTHDYQSVPLRVRGRLTIPAEEAFTQLRPLFEARGCTPRLIHEEGLDVVYALPQVFRHERTGIAWGALILFVLTVLSVFWVGASGELFIPFFEAIAYRLTGSTAGQYASDVLPTAMQFWDAMLNGLMYTAALLGILGAHEMGHFLMARRHKVNTTFPFFIPLPVNILGTLGAVIAMREPAPNRKIQFDIGVAGPLAGMIVAVPVMVLGLYLSEVSTIADIRATFPASIQDEIGFFQEGQSLLYLGLKYAVFGQILPSGDLDVFIHPVAFAAWAGFLVTALNLLPVGQLDGGHVLYGLFGSRAQQARAPVVAMLLLLGLLGLLADLNIFDAGIGWSGWLFWVLLITFLARRHAPVLDEITNLDTRRKLVGVLTLIMFVLIFTPRPLVASIGAILF